MTQEDIRILCFPSSRGLTHWVSLECAAEKAMIQQLTGTDETAGRRCLSGLQVLIKQLTSADQLQPALGEPVPVLALGPQCPSVSVLPAAQ